MKGKKMRANKLTLQQINGLSLLKAVSQTPAGKAITLKLIKEKIIQFKPKNGYVRPATTYEMLTEVTAACVFVDRLTVDRDMKIWELIYWVNKQSTDGKLDDMYITKVEDLCEELGLDVDTVYEKYEGVDSSWSEV